MKKNKDHHFSGIDSLEELRLEKARLMLKGRIMESKLKIDVLQIRETLSLTGFILAISRKFIRQDFTDLLGRFFQK
jgi:hypothetical protein